MNYLIYINGLGPNFKGDNIYEFIFSETKEVWGENWESRPANGYPHPPDIEYITRVGVLNKGGISFDLVQDSDVFSVVDCMDGVLALGWEKENDNLDFSITKNVASMLLSVVLLVWIFGSVARSYARSEQRLPGGLARFLEPIILFVRDDIARPNIGEHRYQRYMPYLLTSFFFIWINNL